MLLENPSQRRGGGGGGGPPPRGGGRGRGRGHSNPRGQQFYDDRSAASHRDNDRQNDRGMEKQRDDYRFPVGFNFFFKKIEIFRFFFQKKVLN